MLSTSVARFDFAKIKKSFDKIGKCNVRLTQSSLILLQDINPNKSVYSFPVLETDNATGIQPEEIRLNQNDEFICTNIGVYLAGKVGASDVVQKGLYYHTYNVYNFTQTANNGQPLYDGFLKIAVNNIVYVDRFDIKKHEKFQRTQWNTRKAVSLNGSTRASINMETDGMFPVAPMVVLSGAKKNEITLNLSQAVGTYSFTSVTNDGVSLDYSVDKIAVIIRGMLGQNSSNFQGASRTIKRK